MHSATTIELPGAKELPGELREEIVAEIGLILQLAQGKARRRGKVETEDARLRILFDWDVIDSGRYNPFEPDENLDELRVIYYRLLVHIKDWVISEARYQSFANEIAYNVAAILSLPGEVEDSVRGNAITLTWEESAA